MLLLMAALPARKTVLQALAANGVDGEALDKSRDEADFIALVGDAKKVFHIRAHDSMYSIPIDGLIVISIY